MNTKKFDPLSWIVTALVIFLIICTAIISMNRGKTTREDTWLIRKGKICTLAAIEENSRTIASDIYQQSGDTVEASTEPDNPYKGIRLTNDEKKLLACMIYSEARGEPFEGQVAVAQVALNRYLHESFNGSISDIISEPGQFTVGKKYEDSQMAAVETALSGAPVLDLNTDVVFFSTGGLKCGTYYRTIGNHVFRTYS